MYSNSKYILGYTLEKKIKISVLIITRKWIKDIHSFNYIMKLKHRNVDFEVLLAEGVNPSTQRNLLARQARGDYLLFLDNDSVPSVDLLEIYRNTVLANPDAVILGGPSVLKKKQNLLYQLSSIFFSSSFGVGPVKNRYNSSGVTRKASEKDLILCNMLIKRDFFLKTKGFDHSLYPGEENEFLKSLSVCSCILYEPCAIVYRKPRRNFCGFVLQLFSYGKGRSKHLKLKNLYEYSFLIPSFFFLYIVSFTFLLKFSKVFAFPLLLHLILSLYVSLSSKDLNLSILERVLTPLFFFSGHFSYGLGLTFGIIRYKLLKRKMPKMPNEKNIKCFKLKNFKKSYT